MARGYDSPRRSARPATFCLYSVFEIQPPFGRAVITSLARMNGMVAGVVGFNPMFGGIAGVRPQPDAMDTGKDGQDHGI